MQRNGLATRDVIVCSPRIRWVFGSRDKHDNSNRRSRVHNSQTPHNSIARRLKGIRSQFSNSRLKFGFACDDFLFNLLEVLFGWLRFRTSTPEEKNGRNAQSQEKKNMFLHSRFSPPIISPSSITQRRRQTFGSTLNAKNRTEPSTDAAFKPEV